jgi:uncharacterized protein involved in type VI secretion and phage assembly
MSVTGGSDLRPIADRLAVPGPAWPGVYVALVTDNEDPDGQGRVKVRLPWSPDSDGQRYEAWARLATLMAGAGRGTWFVPDVADEVLVAFEAGDPRRPFVVGALWNGSDDPPEAMSPGNPKRTILTGKGVRVTLDDTDGQVSLLLETPGGQQVQLTDTPAGVTIQDANGNSVTTGPDGVTVSAAAQVSIKASTVEVNAGMVTVNSGFSSFSGVVKCDTLLASTVVSATYTPGAGNIW